MYHFSLSLTSLSSKFTVLFHEIMCGPRSFTAVRHKVSSNDRKIIHYLKVKGASAQSWDSCCLERDFLIFCALRVKSMSLSPVRYLLVFQFISDSRHLIPQENLNAKMIVSILHHIHFSSNSSNDLFLNLWKSHNLIRDFFFSQHIYSD